ncbi:hypothetical protein EW145_g6452 [Phellinidium pouzarii]|uniref:Signal peptidase complex catalytic subunit SEC11 n=1 Tax=Phellinidium pouzarii TaxID=167371 RepID=A0A4V3XBU1_9AGAM|nr:hypothetical protein EW145_g6452 [Phellinidium pouzarii]
MFAEELKTIRRLGLRYVGPGKLIPFMRRLQRVCRVSHLASVLFCLAAGLGSITDCCCSGSMEPAFYRGDLLFLSNPAGQRYKTGDITVYKIPGGDIPIVHRIIETRDVVSEGHVAASPIAQMQLLLTKGDNNAQDDIGLYEGLQWLEKRHIIGKVSGFLPYIGYVTIAMNDYPQLKYVLLGGLGLLALVSRE